MTNKYKMFSRFCSVFNVFVFALVGLWVSVEIFNYIVPDFHSAIIAIIEHFTTIGFEGTAGSEYYVN